MLKKDQPTQYEVDDQVRRPLAVRIAHDLRLHYPSWAEEEIIAEAKAQTLAQLHGKERMAA